MDRIDELLANGRFEDLVGLTECLQLEAKEVLPDLGTPEGRFELAKDISALANASGGHLIVGVRTARQPEGMVDGIAALTLIDREAFDQSRIQGVLREYLTHLPLDFSLNWYNVGGDGRGLGVVRIPPQLAEDRPFVIAKVVQGAAHLKQIVVGLVERKGSDNIPTTAGGLRKSLRNGMSPLSNRLTSIEEKLDALLARSSPAGADQGEIAVDDAIDEFLRDE